MANYYIGLDWVECLFITEMMTRQELTNQFIPFLIQSFRGDKFLFGDFEKWRKIFGSDFPKVTENPKIENKSEPISSNPIRPWLSSIKMK